MSLSVKMSQRTDEIMMRRMKFFVYEQLKPRIVSYQKRRADAIKDRQIAEKDKQLDHSNN